MNENALLDADEDPVDIDGDTNPDPDVLSIDVTALNVPSESPMAGFSFELAYPSGATEIASADANFMLASGGGNQLWNGNESVPDGDGSWTGGAYDNGTGQSSNVPEYGSGVLERISIRSVSSAMMGLYPLNLSAGAGHYDPLDFNEADTRDGAWIAVNRSCRGAEDISLDMNDALLAPENTSTTVGNVDFCARINNNNIPDADEDLIDLDGNTLPDADVARVEVVISRFPRPHR
jgi:hypothetical protein